MTALAADQLPVTVYVRATPAQVWDALTNGQQTARYYYGSPVESTWEPGAEVAYLTPDRSALMVGGSVVAVDPERRLVLSLRLLYDAAAAAEGSFEQRWEIQAAGEAVTRVSVAHSGLDPAGTSYQQIQGGNPLILSSLKSLLETGTGLPMA
ncbi:MAG TPA: SRPBCC domain-containing protein [Chloroflexota bacterium]|nr:SRPBCC domain-containing protein [Chloroflexota bacterium]